MNLQIRECAFGKGVFTEEPIQIYQKILEFGGEIIPSKSLPFPYVPEKDYFLQIDEDLFLGPSGNMDDFVNHSCNPNSGIRINDNSVDLVAISCIRPGDQITYNYATTMSIDWGLFPCACGSEICVGIVQKFIDLPSFIQKRYIELDIVPRYILANLKQH